MPKTCTQCGRRGVHGTSRCELHPAPVISEAERLARHPYRASYGSAAYRRNRPLAIERARGHCEICGAPHGGAPHVDHRLALRDGGGDELENLQTICQPCHKRKTRQDRRRRRA